MRVVPESRTTAIAYPGSVGVSLPDGLVTDREVKATLNRSTTPVLSDG